MLKGRRKDRDMTTNTNVWTLEDRKLHEAPQASMQEQVHHGVLAHAGSPQTEYITVCRISICIEFDLASILDIVLCDL